MTREFVRKKREEKRSCMSQDEFLSEFGTPALIGLINIMTWSSLMKQAAKSANCGWNILQKVSPD